MEGERVEKTCRMKVFGTRLEFRKLKQNDNMYNIIDPTSHPSTNHTLMQEQQSYYFKTKEMQM